MLTQLISIPKTLSHPLCTSKHEILACREHRRGGREEEYRMGVTLAAIRRDHFACGTHRQGKCQQRPLGVELPIASPRADPAVL